MPDTNHLHLLVNKRCNQTTNYLGRSATQPFTFITFEMGAHYVGNNRETVLNPINNKNYKSVNGHVFTCTGGKELVSEILYIGKYMFSDTEQGRPDDLYHEVIIAVADVDVVVPDHSQNRSTQFLIIKHFCQSLKNC